MRVTESQPATSACIEQALTAEKSATLRRIRPCARERSAPTPAAQKTQVKASCDARTPTASVGKRSKDPSLRCRSAQALVDLCRCPSGQTSETSACQSTMDRKCRRQTSSFRKPKSVAKTKPRRIKRSASASALHRREWTETVTAIPSEAIARKRQVVVDKRMGCRAAAQVRRRCIPAPVASQPLLKSAATTQCASVPLAGISKPPAAADLATASTEKSGNRKLRWDSGKSQSKQRSRQASLDGKSGEGRVLARALAIAQ